MNDYISTAPLDGYYLAHHGIKGQKWGIQNGPPYPLDESNIANKLYANAKSYLNKISSDVKDAAEKSGSKLYGLEHQLKTVESIERKINKKSLEDKVSKSEAAKQIKDVIRFTTISSENDFVNNYYTFKKSLEDKGYKESRCKNYFELFKQGKVMHKAVQSNFVSDDGYSFEVQFHTKSSQNVKDKKVGLYEEARNIKTTTARKMQIEKQMKQMAFDIKDPKNIEQIQSH